MKKEREVFENGAIIALVTKRTAENPSIENITDSILLETFRCEVCRFVALWHGDP